MLLLKSLPFHPFDYNFLMWILQSYSSPRDKISRMIKKGEIIQIKKGLYTLPPEYGGIIDRRLIANLIYGPSYISLDFALQYWGLIPERVQEVTCITNKRNKYFTTPFGNFSYQYRHNSKYYPGIILQKDHNSILSINSPARPSFFIATKEKALCDKIALVPEIKNTDDVASYLENDLRIDFEDIVEFDLKVLDTIERAYKKRSISHFLSFCKKFQRS